MSIEVSGDKAPLNKNRNPPDADRAIWGFRDTGYSVETAAADVVDNSIAAGAGNVFLKVELLTDGRRLVYFGDDGCGMNEDELHNAMRYGSPERADKASLGKFGLGLKTASTAICIQLTVISCRQGGELSKLSWDLDHVAEVNDWLMLEQPITEDEREKFEELCGDKGTLVIWSKCDRLLSKRDFEPGGTEERRALKKLKDKLADHFSLVYHRFLDHADGRARNVSIKIDDEPVLPWSPFFEEKSESVLPRDNERIAIHCEDGTEAEAVVRAWILPPKEDMTKEEIDSAKLANHRQGFYVYRENRIISAGGWNGVFGSNEPHMTLIRVQFDFDHRADEALQVDVKKSRVNFDPHLEEYLQRLLVPPRREANNRSRRKQQSKASKGINHTASNINITHTPNTAKPDIVSVDEPSNSVLINNSRGKGLRITAAVEKAADKSELHVRPAPLATGDLWEPVYRQLDNEPYSVGVHINSQHDFYTKVYQSARSAGHAVEGMDLLLWALAVAEQNNINEEMVPIFQELRQDISGNLRKLLRNRDVPDFEDDD